MPKAQKNLAIKNQVVTGVELGDRNREKIKNNFKHFDLSFFISKSYFDDDGSQNQFNISTNCKSFKVFNCSTDKFFGWKSKALSKESIPTPAVVILQNLLIFIIPKQLQKLERCYSKQDKYFLLMEML